MNLGKYRLATFIGTLALAAALPACLLPLHPEPPTDMPYKRDAGPYRVIQETHVWHDLDRLRDIPVRLYLPEDQPGPCPVIVFSHGFATSRDHHTYLGTHWASHGYTAVFLSHPGSDSSLYKTTEGLIEAMLTAVENPENRRERPRDISFVLDQLETARGLRDRVDMDRVAVAGHSFGAFTALATIGMRFDLPDQPDAQYSDPRVKAVIAMSPQGTGDWGLHEHSWDSLETPCMTMMGTLDFDVYLVTDASERRAAYEHSTAPDQYLVTLQNATHLAFDDRVLITSDFTMTKPHHEHILMASIAFLDAHLLGERDAQKWLLRYSLDAISNGTCTTEYKNITEIESY